MEYRAIKRLYKGAEEYSGLYEISKDGLSIKRIGLDKSVSLKGKESFKLKSAEGNMRSFGLRTLYRFAWGKALPYELEGKEPITRKRKTPAQKAAIAAQKAEKAKRRELRLALKVRRGRLLSKVNQDRLATSVRSAKRKGNAGMVRINDKRVFVQVVIAKEKSENIILRMESQSAMRNGYFFYNLKTGNHMKFDKDIHKPGYGNDAIKWPKAL